METASPALNVAANKLAQKWLAEIRLQIDALPPKTQAGCWLAILDRCALKRPERRTSFTREQMIENVSARLRSLNEQYAGRWRWAAQYKQFGEDCGIFAAPAIDEVAAGFAAAVQEAIGYERYNLTQLLKLKEQIVDAILTFHGHRRAALVTADSLEGVRLADEWIAKMEADIVDIELKGRERFWEKVALGAQAWDLPATA